ncbi:MAG: bifunctional UDP-N-acetylmuramoyl-tripeptide:D-alanyl-D-alanine ligase/alanine racemase [Gemmatimonadaceae bacterium]|nr:bifunctional UDP-N-acetylmuramoyl-tripeptide:D-alanyl-D-alanine ligase/alanine racemase [Chitinophagaceae bacterium]
MTNTLYTIENIAAIVKGQLSGGSATTLIEHLALDSRKILFPGTSAFFALKGGRRDGHGFLEEVYEKGIRCFILNAETTHQLPEDAAIITVKDTLSALQQLAAFHRKQFSIPVIGITGSNGKTIVKEWLNQILEQKYNIVRSPKSYNSQIGVPLSVWQINAEHNLAIFEAGISQSGEMDKLEKIIQPTIGIFTNIGEAHSEGFLNLRQKVKEKLQLFKHVQTLIYCTDYPEINEGVADLVQRLRNKPEDKLNLFSWSMKTDAVLRIISLIRDTEYVYISAEYRNREISIRIPLLDNASLENSINCWCLLLHMGKEDSFIQQKMEQLGNVPMRLELKKGINNCSIINDSYSADLSSLKIALDFLAQQQQHHKKTVILSDILQSGKSDTALYEVVAATLKQKKINRFIGIGPQMIRHKQPFETVAGLEVKLYESIEAFRKDFYNLHFQNETILLKGARVFAFEQIIPLLEQKVHQTMLEINLTSFVHNLRQYQHLLAPTTKIMAMVKAFSYGSGSFEIANLLQFHKVDYLAVAYADEGVELRQAGITLPIMVMNPEESSFDAIVQFQLEPDIYSPELLESFNRFLESSALTDYNIHVELETGMNRLGFDISDIRTAAEKLKNSRCRVQSVFSHLVGSEDAAQDEFTRKQGATFLEACEQLSSVLGHNFIKHMLNTAGISRHPEMQFDMVRLGIGLYGIDSTDSGSLQLKEVSTLKTTIAQIKHLKKGDTVSYGRKGVIKKDSLIATVRLGYADGYPRRLSNGKGKMMVAGKAAPVIGNICMDMTMLDITGIPNISEGEDVIVFGDQLSINELAEWAETIPYEIMTGISQRVKRVYIEE